MLRCVAALLVLHYVDAFFGGGGGGLTALDLMRMQGHGGAFGGMGMMGMGGMMETPPPPTYDQLYADAVEAYSGEKWEETISLMEQALDDYRSYHEGLIQCKRQCRDPKETDSQIPKDFSTDLEFQCFYSVLMYGACVKRCKKIKFGNRVWADVSEEVREAFETRNTYNYMQLALYKVGNLTQAAQAASTYLYYNPEDEVGQNNIEYYKTLGLKESNFEPLETEKHMDAYEKAVQFYEKEEWGAAIEAFEDAIVKYLLKYEECRLVCEGRSIERTPDLATMLSGSVQSLLQCRSDCPHKLGTNRKKDVLYQFFESHFHYLQFAYYKADKVKKAVECAMTYLLYHPDDEVMLNNIRHYKEVEGIKDEDFVPRQDISLKRKIEEAEEKLLEVTYGQPEEDEFRQQMTLDDPMMDESPPPPPPPSEFLPPSEPSDSEIEVIPVVDEIIPTDPSNANQQDANQSQKSAGGENIEKPAVVASDGETDEKLEPNNRETKPEGKQEEAEKTKKGKKANKDNSEL